MEEGWTPRDILFTGTPGAHFQPLTAGSTPVEFLQLYLTDRMLSDIVEQTNLYAAQCIPKVKLYNVLGIT